MTLWTNTAEGGTDTVNVTAANSGGASGDAWTNDPIVTGGTVTYSATQKQKGTRSYKIDNTSNANVYLDWRPTPSRQMVCRFYIYLSGTLNTYTTWLMFQPASANAYISLTTNGSRQLRVDSFAATFPNWTGTGNTYSPPLATATWYRIELKVDNSGGTSAGTSTCQIYVGDSGTLFDEASATGQNYGGANFEKFYLGRYGGTTGLGNPVYLDDISLADSSTTMLGPTASSVDPFTWTKTITIGG